MLRKWFHFVKFGWTKRFRVVFWLMRVAGAETLERGYTHYVTEVFEGEEHSPYRFHTRVLGFQPVATHEAGEMDCLHRRITLVLNLKDAYQRLCDSQNRLCDFLTDGLDAPLLHRLSTEVHVGPIPFSVSAAERVVFRIA